MEKKEIDLMEDRRLRRRVESAEKVESDERSRTKKGEGRTILIVESGRCISLRSLVYVFEG